LKPGDLISQARELASSSPRRPVQANLKRAASAAYYALFHALATSAADTLIGTTHALRTGGAWQRVYRSLEHGYAKAQCSAVRSASSIVPAPLHTVADDFVELQGLRHEADYDPFSSFSRAAIEARIAQAENAIALLSAASVTDRRSLAAWLLFKPKG
jgi:hypothetical protein